MADQNRSIWVQMDDITVDIEVRREVAPGERFDPQNPDLTGVITLVTPEGERFDISFFSFGAAPSFFRELARLAEAAKSQGESWLVPQVDLKRA